MDPEAVITCRPADNIAPGTGNLQRAEFKDIAKSEEDVLVADPVPPGGPQVPGLAGRGT
ncbi:MAG: hypothetical protein ACLSHO_11025 [Dysosmobacter sp.]